MNTREIKGVMAMAAMFNIKKDQSVTNAFAGMAIKVMALSNVPKTLRPLAHQGIRPPRQSNRSWTFVCKRNTPQ